VTRLYRRILHPTDFSAASRRAFASAVALARRDRAELLLLHVLASPAAFRRQRVRDAGDLAADRGRGRARRVPPDGDARPGDTGGRTGAGDPRRGRPVSSQILRTARARRADLIVIAPTAGSADFAALHRSVAVRVIQLAPCPC